MIAAAVIACAVCAIVVVLSYLVQSERAHERTEKARLRREMEILEAERYLNDALKSHNLARIAAARAHLHRVRGE